jgi:hypothetical protein
MIRLLPTGFISNSISEVSRCLVGSAVTAMLLVRAAAPFQEIIDIQAAVALPEIGGYGTARSTNFRYREILHFDVAHSAVTGSNSNGKGNGFVHNTLIKATVEGCNITGMVTADRGGELGFRARWRF